MKNNQISLGNGAGSGHVSNSKLPAILEITKTAKGQVFIKGLQPGTRVFQLGRCTIGISPPFMGHGWHMTISHPDRYPTWDEVAKARYELCPNEIEMVMHLPPQEEYISIHTYCFQLHELVEYRQS